jgi:hypothetical protein
MQRARNASYRISSICLDKLKAEYRQFDLVALCNHYLPIRRCSHVRHANSFPHAARRYPGRHGPMTAFIRVEWSCQRLQAGIAVTP